MDVHWRAATNVLHLGDQEVQERADWIILLDQVDKVDARQWKVSSTGQLPAWVSLYTLT